MTPLKTIAQAGQVLEELFELHFGKKPETVTHLPVSGSDRRYFRMRHGGDSVIGTYNTNISENNTFFYFSELFKKHGINVPEVYRIGKDRRSYLQQDLGDRSLFDQLQEEGYTDAVRKNYHKSLEQLAGLQWLAGREVDYKQCFSAREFNDQAIMADLMYFKYYFADLQGVHYDRFALMGELESLCRELGGVQPRMLMYRDFQSRNIMLHDGKIWFIDYQGSMQGPPQYDIASLLWQARAQLPAAWREDLLNGYIESMNRLQISRIDEIHFRRGYAQFVLLRLMQVLGAYGFRGLIGRKPHFITSIGPALKNLETFLSDYPQIPAYPELRSLLEKLCAPEIQAKYTRPGLAGSHSLKIQVNSFSYKTGIPSDKSGHGGGYVFDCRSILNPGRYAAYKHLTGLDEPVRLFLRQQTQMPEFMEHVSALVSMHVEDYLERGFEQLTISFGCTGGQHRSVYAAEQLAAIIRERYNLPVSIAHLNEKKWVLNI